MKILMLGRLEKVKLSCTYSRVKIVGTLLCVLGALTLSIMQSISAPPKSNKVGTIQSPSPPIHVTFDSHKLIGCLYLLVAILILSSNIVLQVTCIVRLLHQRIDFLLLMFSNMLLPEIVILVGLYSGRFSCTDVVVFNNLLFWDIHDCCSSIN